MPTNPRLPFDEDPLPPDPQLARDMAAREFAVDPSRNVVLEASAGTGKTRVLVTRYVNLLRAGVDPANILAITFTRKAAAEMRERIVRELRGLASQSPADAARWRELRDRLSEIGISTIDAFCLALLREFPLEADLDPGFQVADDTEVARLADEALDTALRAGRRLARHDEDVGLVLAGLGERRLRNGLAALLDRRLVVARALRRFIAAAPAPAPSVAFAQATSRLASLLDPVAGSLERFLADGPVNHPAYALVEADLQALASSSTPGHASAAHRRAAVERLSTYFLTKDGGPRRRPAPAYRKDDCRSPDAWKRHSQVLAQVAPYVAETLGSLERDLNRAMARGVEKLFRVAAWRYRRALDLQAAVDFGEGLARTLMLLRKMDEFAQSRYRLEARYHHVLVDEFQDTSGAQWRLVSRLIQSWGEGVGLAHDAPLQPSVFIVGDRKQSIYAFRDADVRLLRRARKHIAALRPGADVRRSIARSFRSAPALLAFANDLFAAIDKVPVRADAFRYGAADRFPVHLAAAACGPGDPLGLVVAHSRQEVADSVAGEIDRILQVETVRDRQTGLARPARPGDIAILFRSRESHREFEASLEQRGIRTYVYKGLGFFDADEVKDLLALLRYLAEPSSDVRAAAFLRSRFIRLSDLALRLLAPSFAAALSGDTPPRREFLPREDGRVLRRLRGALPGWLALADRLPPAELLDRILEESAYAFELRGAREAQARENVKKVRALLRRVQNRGYATLPRIADHLERLSAGDESNAIIDAVDAVNLMTVHAAKGLEFPIVFLVNLGRGTGSRGDTILVVPEPRHGQPLVSVGGGLPDAEDATRARDVEETKRLLYVAVTRARERLYLSAVLKDGRLRPGRGSLGEVLPDALRDVLTSAAGRPDAATVEWLAPGGVHRFRVCGVPRANGSAEAVISRPAPDPTPQQAGTDDFGPWRDVDAIVRVPVTTLVSGRTLATLDPGTQPPSGGADRAGRRLAGTLVHRLFQANQASDDMDQPCLVQRALALVSPEELLGAEDANAAVEEAVASFVALRGRPDVTELLDAAHCLYEVPFSYSLQVDDEDMVRERPAAIRRPAVIRGIIDCLATLPDGRIVVVEIKTGRPHEWHDVQLEWYVRAARALFPARPVEGKVLYA